MKRINHKGHASSDEQTQQKQTLALRQILSLGERQIEEGKVQPAADVFKRLSERQ